jgi:uracil phosphoribosyltransferase
MIGPSTALDNSDALTCSPCALGGSAIMAVDVLKARGVPEERILFLNLIASPQGIENFATKFPKLRVVTAFVDQVSKPFLMVSSPY